ncbi:hypothetical protein NDI56_15085 [Haloarcula sp. S1CR25-12]|uniref:Uncharacterized protein n=1 Tax=Haloarcula saliterrae TaxID=2950534 RepID=A0ABU2FEP1_9EURY|nr:hypothetical protein [Haloarcula sp. S1CR25-12]MDS0260730.1 hypothetical protein [Haloarcula sp. S1CR25-12]
MSAPESPTGGLPRFSVGASAVAVLVVAALVAPAPAPLGVALLGGGLLAAGLVRRRDAPLAVGAGALFSAVVLAGIDGKSTGWLLLAAVPAVLAWTSARDAVRLGRQVGRAASTLRVELVRTVSTLTALVAGGGAGYLLERTLTGGESPLALALLLVAVVAFTLALR